MKHSVILKLLCGALLVLLLLGGAALAENEGEIHQGQMELFNAGGIPAPMRMRTVTPVGFEEYIVEQLSAQPESIVVIDYAMQPAQFVQELTRVVNDHPDLFYIGTSVRYTTGTTSGNVYRYYPEYKYTGEDLQNRIAAFNQTVNEIAGYARSVSSHPMGQMMAVNDYFCIHYEYDDSLSIHGPDQLFSGGTGVCQAYMLGYAAVLDELGIPNTHATSVSMKHTWNLVQLNGNWYHVDVTWNDPVDTTMLSSYRYFLYSDTGMTGAAHYGWTASYAANDASWDNAFWRSTYTPMGINGNTLYFLSDVAANGTRTIRTWNMNTYAWGSLVYFSITDASGSYITSNAYNPIAVDGEKVYFATRGNLYWLNHDGTGSVLIHSGDDSAYIWSCWMDGENIRMLVGDTSLQNTRVITLRVNGELTLPASTREIRQEAFAGTLARWITLPGSVQTIGERAFAGSPLLSSVNIPASVTSIADNAFENCLSLRLKVTSGSYGESYAIGKGIAYDIIG